MKKLFNSILLGICLSFCLSVSGQDIGIDTSAFNLKSLPDTININDNFFHHITFKNKSATLYTGNIDLMVGIDSMGTLISVDSVGTVFVSNFGLNDTAGVSYSETYNFINSYKTGGNIVVVWPAADFGTTKDSLFKNVFIDFGISINENNSSYYPYLIYPNPSKDYIYFTIRDHQKPFKQVRIYDVNGKLIYNEKFKPKINICQFQKGMYIIQVDNEKVYYKLIKE